MFAIDFLSFDIEADRAGTWRYIIIIKLEYTS